MAHMNEVRGESAGVLPNEVAMNAAISACEEAGQWQIALELLQRMTTSSLGVGRISFNAAMSSLPRAPTVFPKKARLYVYQ